MLAQRRVDLGLRAGAPGLAVAGRHGAARGDVSRDAGAAVANVAADDQRRGVARDELDSDAEPGHRAGRRRETAARFVVPRDHRDRVTLAERQRQTGLQAQRVCLRVAARGEGSPQLGRHAQPHAQRRAGDRALGILGARLQRVRVLVARAGIIGGALERATIVIEVVRRRRVDGQALPHGELRVEVALDLERPGQHLTRADVGGIARQIAAEHADRAVPIFVHHVRVRLVEPDLGVEGGRFRPHPIVDAIGQHVEATARVDAREPELLHAVGREVADLQLRDPVLALRFVVAPEREQRLAAQVMQLGIALVTFEMVRAFERLGGVFEIAGCLRRARGVALRGRVVGRDPQDLLEFAARTSEVALRQRRVGLGAQAFDLLLLLRCRRRRRVDVVQFAVVVAGGGRGRAVPARGGFRGELPDRNDQDAHYTKHRTERTDREAPHAEGPHVQPTCPARAARFDRARHASVTNDPSLLRCAWSPTLSRASRRDRNCRRRASWHTPSPD